MHQDEVLGVRERFRLGAEPRCKADGVGEVLSGAVLEAAGDADQLIGSAAQFVADVVDQEIDIAVAADDAGEDLTGHRLRRSKNDRLDAPHPCAPAQVRRQVRQLDVKSLR